MRLNIDFIRNIGFRFIERVCTFFQETLAETWTLFNIILQDPGSTCIGLKSTPKILSTRKPRIRLDFPCDQLYTFRMYLAVKGGSWFLIIAGSAGSKADHFPGWESSV